MNQPQGAGALVRMSNVQEARQAIQSLHNQRLPGSIAPLVVRFADSAEQKAKKATRMGRAYDRWAAAWAGGGSGGSGSGYAGGYGGHSGELRSLGSLGSDFGGYGGGGGLLRDRESSIYIKYLPDTVRVEGFCVCVGGSKHKGPGLSYAHGCNRRDRA